MPLLLRSAGRFGAFPRGQLSRMRTLCEAGRAVSRGGGLRTVQLARHGQGDFGLGSRYGGSVASVTCRPNKRPVDTPIPPQNHSHLLLL